MEGTLLHTCSVLAWLLLCQQSAAVFGTEVVYCTENAALGDCQTCSGERANLSCAYDHTVVIDDVIVSYTSPAFASAPGGCRDDTNCNSTTAAISQINACSWQHSSCEIIVSPLIIRSHDCGLAQLSHAFVDYHCQPNIKIYNFGRSSTQQLEFSNTNDTFYLLSPCHPRNYADCEYYATNTPSDVSITNTIPRHSIKVTKIAMQSCDLEIVSGQEQNICSRLQSAGEITFAGQSVDLRFMGNTADQSGFLLSLSVIEVEAEARVSEVTDDVVYCADNAPFGDCIGCVNQSINTSCSLEETVVIDDFIASYSPASSRSQIRGCRDDTHCNSSTVATSLINACTWQKSSCKFEISPYITTRDCGFIPRLSHAYIKYHCESNTKIHNFGRSDPQQIELNNTSDSYYLLSPCHPRYYGDCEYYALNTASVFIVMNTLPNHAVNIRALSLDSCELQLFSDDPLSPENLCAELEGSQRQVNVSGSSFRLQFRGTGSVVQSGFLLLLSVIEFQGEVEHETTHTEDLGATTPPTSTDSSTQSSGISQTNIIVIVAVAIAVVILLAVAIAVAFCWLRTKQHAQKFTPRSEGKGCPHEHINLNGLSLNGMAQGQHTQNGRVTYPIENGYAHDDGNSSIADGMHF